MFKNLIEAIASTIKHNTAQPVQGYEVTVNGIATICPELAEELSHWTPVQ